jgi:hypothetical protein
MKTGTEVWEKGNKKSVLTQPTSKEMRMRTRLNLMYSSQVKKEK